MAPRLDLHPGYAGRPHRSPRSVQGRSGHELSVPAADGRRGPGGCRRRREVLRPERLRVRARRRFRSGRRERPLAVPGLRHRHPSGLQRLGGLQGAVLLSRRDRELPGRGCLGAHAAAYRQDGQRLDQLRLRRRDPGPEAERGGCRQPCRRLHLAGHGQPERGHAQGRRPHRADAFGRRKRVLHDLRRLRHLRLPAGRFRGRGVRARG